MSLVIQMLPGQWSAKEKDLKVELLATEIHRVPGDCDSQSEGPPREAVALLWHEVHCRKLWSNQSSIALHLHMEVQTSKKRCVKFTWEKNELFNKHTLQCYIKTKPWPTVATSFRLLHIHGDVTPVRPGSRAVPEFSEQWLSLQGLGN